MIHKKCSIIKRYFYSYMDGTIDHNGFHMNYKMFKKSFKDFIMKDSFWYFTGAVNHYENTSESFDLRNVFFWHLLRPQGDFTTEFTVKYRRQTTHIGLNTVFILLSISLMLSIFKLSIFRKSISKTL